MLAVLSVTSLLLAALVLTGAGAWLFTPDIPEEKTW